MLAQVYNDDHDEFAKCFDRIFVSYYIRELSKYLREYLRHCSQCQIYQIKRHKFYESLQSIFTSFVSFHTLIIDFILTLLKSMKRYKIFMSISCKFIKRITLLLEKSTFFATQWKEALLDHLNIVD